MFRLLAFSYARIVISAHFRFAMNKFIGVVIGDLTDKFHGWETHKKRDGNNTN